MRWRTFVAALLVVGVVVLAASWFGVSGREGLTPVEPASPGAEGIDDLYLFIGGIAVLIFLSVMVPLALILGRYRERGLGREAEGPQVRGHVRLELLWTAIPLGLVLMISGFTLYKAEGIRDPAPVDGQPTLRIQVEGRQFYWRYVYPNDAVAVDRLRVPVDRVVELDLAAPGEDVVHSFWVPALGGKVDAIPGEVTHLKFRPRRTGVFDGKCAELCGIQHAAMLFEVEVLPQDDFERWLDEEGAAQQTGRSQLGKEQWENVCLKCHFAAPEYAPNLAGNPLLADAEQIRSIVTNGRGEMPAVGRGWTERELDALTSYLRTLAGGADGS